MFGVMYIIYAYIILGVCCILDVFACVRFIFVQLVTVIFICFRMQVVIENKIAL